MKTLLFLFAFLALQTLAPAQLITEVSIPPEKSSPTIFDHDITLVKPLLNYNEPDGGYYSEYYYTSFDSLLCAAIVKNNGNIAATNVYFEFSVLNWDYSEIELDYSEIIPLLNPGETDTLKIPFSLTFPWLWTSGYAPVQYRFVAKCDFADENPADNLDTVPFTIFNDNMWTYVSRSIYPSKPVDITQIPGFESGDFLGFTLKTRGWWHWLVYMQMYFPGEWPTGLTAEAKIFCNGNVVDSAAFLGYTGQTGWFFSDSFLGMNPFIYPDSLYYVGVEFQWDPGTHAIIGGDTSSYHNFPAETIARIGNTWTTLDFVPLIQLICDPEGIEETNNADQARVYPNPASGTLYLEHVGGSKIELYDLTGGLHLAECSSGSTRTIDLSSLPAGVYILRIQNDHESTSRRITVMK